MSLEPKDTARGNVGFFSLGSGVIAVPVASMIYVGLAWMTVVAMTACVDARTMLCLAGPLLGTALLFATALALAALVAAVAMLLAAGAALVRQRALYLAGVLGAGTVMAAAGTMVLLRASGLTTASLESAELEAGWIALAVGAPLAASGLACLIAAALRGIRAVVAPSGGRGEV